MWRPPDIKWRPPDKIFFLLGIIRLPYIRVLGYYTLFYKKKINHIVMKLKEVNFDSSKGFVNVQMFSLYPSHNIGYVIKGKLKQ